MAKTKQLNHPCSDCAFLRTSTPGNLGGSPAETYVGQIRGPFWIPCHSSKDYRYKCSAMGEEAECVGSAILRANLGIIDCMPPGLLHPEADTEIVFANYEEFVAHHKGITIEQATAELKEVTPAMHLQREANDPQVRGV